LVGFDTLLLPPEELDSKFRNLMFIVDYVMPLGVLFDRRTFSCHKSSEVSWRRVREEEKPKDQRRVLSVGQKSKKRCTLYPRVPHIFSQENKIQLVYYLLSVAMGLSCET
jgi:hypothetical protein